jgi:hypothetical protein
MRWARHVVWTGEINKSYEMSVGETERKNPTGRAN